MFHPYVLIGSAVVVGGLTLTSALFYQKARAESARADAAVALQEQYKQDLAESEADKELIRQRQRELDAAIRVRDGRLRDLEKAKQALDAEYEALREKVAQEDQACLDRSLPPAIAERLRD